MKNLILNLLILFFVVSNSTAIPTNNINAEELLKIGLIRGKIVDIDSMDKPLEDAKIFLKQKKDSTLIASVQSTSEGKFEIKDIPLGDYFIEILFNGYFSATIPNINIISNNNLCVLGDIPIIKKRESNEIIPDEDAFIPVEKEAKVSNLWDLQKMILYPPIAVSKKLSGKVVVNVFIDKTGKPKKAKIVYSDNTILDQAAIDAVMNYRGYIPAIQKKQPIGTWIAIPIKFELSK